MLSSDRFNNDAGNILKKFMIVAIAFCVSFSTQAQPLSAGKSEVKNCEFIKTVKGFSHYGKNWNWEKVAKHYALLKAQKLGADRVVWTKMYPQGVFNGTAVGKAYDCKHHPL